MKRLKFRLAFAVGLMATVALATLPEVPAGDRIPKADPAKAVAAIPQPVAKKYPRGRKQSPDHVVDARHARAFQRHDHKNQGLPRAPQASYDLRSVGKALPAGDQGQCGDCYMDSTCRVASTAYVRASAGALKYDNSFRFATQYGLDCHPELGGCNGGDEAEVAELLKTKGFPITADYGQYYASPQRCKAGAKVYTIQDYVYCTPSQQRGVATTADIKAAILQYGEVSTAIVADSSWDGYRGGVLPFEQSSPYQVDHAVSIVGWSDDTSLRGGGYWIVMNQWGNDWGENGCVRIQYGSHQIGTEAFAVTCAGPPPAPVPPTPPGPVPPGPVPPAPPAPVTVTLTGTTQPYSFTVGSWPFHETVTIPGQTVTVTGMLPRAAAGQLSFPQPMPARGLSIDVFFALIRLERDIRASGHGHLAADFTAMMAAVRSGSGVLAAMETLAIDLMAVGSDPAVLADLQRLAADLGIALPVKSPVLTGKPCCDK